MIARALTVPSRQRLEALTTGAILIATALTAICVPLLLG